MPLSDSLLLTVWREACRHIELGESTATIARRLTDHLPLAELLVRRFDLPHSAIETLAVGPGPAAEGRFARTICSPQQLKRLMAWATRGELLHRGRRRLSRELSLLAPLGTRGDVLAGPLLGLSSPAGVLVLTSRERERFGEAHAQIARAMLEPFSVALENDRRLHELTALRESAEADRRSLLTRLGRHDLSETIVGASTGLKPVMERVELVATSDVPVLILGETGTGKEVVARAIHARSNRSAGPFIRINCGAIPPELIDSQLFGHERGSFTGAVDTRQGWFERADGGTLFLDEIGELPLAAQVRLLRVLQDGYVERVGGHSPIRVDVRVVAATHRDLSAMVRAGSFREDLWYRIAVFPMFLPPLRDRREDIPALARHFAEKAATRFGLMLVLPSPEHIRALADYSWPGNIRELGAVIDRAAILGEGRALEVVKALGVTPATSPQRGAKDGADSGVTGSPMGLLSLEQAMARHIELALRATRGRIEGPDGAAALLGINPHTLRARMRKLKLDWSRYRAPSLD